MRHSKHDEVYHGQSTGASNDLIVALIIWYVEFFLKIYIRISLFT